MGHRGDVQATGGHVGRDDDGQLAVTEGLQGGEALLLGHVARDDADVEAFALQALEDPGALGLRLAEDDRVGHVRLAQQRRQGLNLLVLGDAGELVLQIGRGGVSRTHFNLLRLAHVFVRDSRNLGRERRAEQQRLFLLGALAEDELQIVLEAHIQHLVGLVEDDDLAGIQVEVPALDHVAQAARRADHDRGPLHLVDLIQDLHAAEDDSDDDLEVLRHARELVGDLHRELAGGADHQHLRVRAGAVDAMEGGQAEGQGLARARAGLGHQVLPAGDGGNGLQLHRGGVGVAHVGQTLEQIRLQPDFCAQLGERLGFFPSDGRRRRRRLRGVLGFFQCLEGPSCGVTRVGQSGRSPGALHYSISQARRLGPSGRLARANRPNARRYFFPKSFLKKPPPLRALSISSRIAR
ncbi:hypothetical protein D3C72_445620 [compost metagenome]